MNGPESGMPVAAREPHTMLERAWNILVSPRDEWTRIANEHASPSSLYVGYAAPLVGLAAVMSFLQRCLIGTWMPLSSRLAKAAPSEALQFAVSSFLYGLVGLFVLALIIHLLAPAFGARRNLGQAMKAAVYSATPACVGSVFALLPLLGALIGLMLMLYGVYVLYVGLVPVMGAPRERAVGYTAGVIAVMLVLGVLVAALGTAMSGL